MDNSDIGEYVSGVSMDGTEFGFEALCSSVSNARMTRMIVRWLHGELKKLHPERDTFTEEECNQVFHDNISEIEVIIRKRFSTVQRNTRRSLKLTFGIDD